MSMTKTVKNEVRTRLEGLRPDPWSDLNVPRKGLRVFLILLGLSNFFMAAAAMTADSDWNLTQEKVEKQFG